MNRSFRLIGVIGQFVTPVCTVVKLRSERFALFVELPYTIDEYLLRWYR